MRHVQLKKIVFGVLMFLPFFLGVTPNSWAAGIGSNPPPPGFKRTGPNANGTLTYTVISTGGMSDSEVLDFVGQCSGTPVTYTADITGDTDLAFFEDSTKEEIADNLEGKVLPGTGGDNPPGLSLCYTNSNRFVSFVELHHVVRAVSKTSTTVGETTITTWVGEIGVKGLYN